jgi:hypothetical protein
MPGIMDRNKDGIFGVFWKCARIGERLSPYVSLACVAMAVSLFLPIFFWGRVFVVGERADWG